MYMLDDWLYVSRKVLRFDSIVDDILINGIQIMFS